MFLVVTIVGVGLGLAYAKLIDRRFAAKDWRRWAAFAPFWLLGVGLAIAVGSVNMATLPTQAIAAFAMGSFLEALLDATGLLRPRRDVAEGEMAKRSTLEQSTTER